MKKGEVYRLLVAKLFGPFDYEQIPVHPIDEKLVFVPTTAALRGRPIDPQMRPFTGDKVYVRQSVLEKLLQASSLLSSSELILEVVYGFRTLEIQTRLFEKYKSRYQGPYEGKELIEAVHRYIAWPEVAGHPTGGAVDVQIVKRDQPLDYGTKIWEFVDDSLVFSPFISTEGWHNRQFLRRVMMAVGFAPFDGEWWHFSYGDKEWAKYYGKTFALYSPIPLPVQRHLEGLN